MKTAAMLEQRQAQWKELEQLCDSLGSVSRDPQTGAQAVARFAALYRSACADLALADAYQLPPGTVAYLHRLVGRAHNRLYRSKPFAPRTWVDLFFRDAPQRIFADPCVRFAAIIFFGLFSLSLYLAHQAEAFPDYAQGILGDTMIESMETMYEEPPRGDVGQYTMGTSFYISHNTGIGLRCFAFGILLVPCVFTLASNAVILGAVFGYMSRPDVASGDHFLEFVTAHGPFELTAIALSAAAGLRLGLGLFATGGLSRYDSLRKNALRAVPLIVAASLLFVLAAFTEGFISPSRLPYAIKAGWAIGSSGLITFYFVVLGFPRSGEINDAA